MKVYSIVDDSVVNGPGERLVIWTAGCDLNCPGCWNPDTHDINHGTYYSIPELMFYIQQVFSIKPLKEGITISGGEPFQQPQELLALINTFKADFPDRSVGLFTGYSRIELDYLFASRPFLSREYISCLVWKSIFEQKLVDFAVMGRYNQKLVKIDTPMLTSTNQELVLLTDRYSKSDFERQSIEITINPDGTKVTTGFPVGNWEYFLDRND